jgi:hypothetical protein
MSKLFIFKLDIAKKLSYILIILSIIFCNFNQIKTENELAEKLNLVINSIAEEMPDKYVDYFTYIRSTGFLKIDKFDLSNASQRLKNIHKFSGEVIEYFEDIVYAESTHFKTFSISIRPLDSIYYELIGAARVINNQVELAYIEIDTVSGNIPKRIEIILDYCTPYFFYWRFCVKRLDNIDASYTTEDMTIIYKSLRAHSYKHIKRTTDKILSALESKEFVLSENSKYFSDNGQIFLKIQEDGNLVLYKIENNNDIPSWASQTYGKGNNPYMLVIEKCGDLIVYDSNWTIIWMADFEKNENLPYTLEISDEGIMELKDFMGNLMWKNGDKAKYDVVKENNMRFLQ